MLIFRWSPGRSLLPIPAKRNCRSTRCRIVPSPASSFCRRKCRPASTGCYEINWDGCRPIHVGLDGVRIVARGGHYWTNNLPDLIVTRDAGTTIALCLHELITNAIKYGSLSHPSGHAEIVWAVIKPNVPEFSLNWAEVGGPPVREPTRQGYGTR